MGNLSSIFNGMGEKPENSYEPLPEGWYRVTIAGAEVCQTKAGTGHYIKVQYKTDTGRVVFGNLNIRNPNPEAQRIGQEQFYQLRTAIGLGQVQDTDQLIGAVLQIKLAIRKSEEYGDSNDVKGFKAVEGAAPPKAIAPAQERAPASTPPWAKND